MLCRLLLLIIFLLVFSTGAYAQPSNPMRFKIDRPCDGMGELCGPRIYAEGEIQSDTPDRFVAFVRLNRAELPPVTTVVLDSPGGNMFAGMELGRAIRSLAFDTEILDEQICASACALAFLGGATREFDRSGKFGVHQFSSADGNMGDSLTQVTVVAVATYIESMGVDRSLLDVASLVPTSSIYWLTDEQRRQLRVDNSQTTYSKWMLDSDQAGNPYVYATLLLAGDRLKAYYMLHRTGQDVTLQIHLIVPTHKVDRLSNLDLFLDYISIYRDKQLVFKSPTLHWQATKTTRTTEVRLPRAALENIGRSEQIAFVFSIPRAANDMDPSLSMPDTALGRFINTILR